jgi:cobalt-zinc-cadmium efflux system protein
LVVIALFIFWEAAQRLRKPEAVASWPMIGVALAAMVVNVLISLWLRGGAKHDLNVRSAYLHMVGDALAAVGVVVAGVIVLLTGESAADPVVSLLIGVLILWSSWGILSESVGVLMEGVPKGLDMGRVAESVAGVEGVLGVHHLHVWTVASSLVACSCHVRIAPDRTLADAVQVQAAVAGVLERDHGIAHTTVQIEIEDCGKGELHCTQHPVHHDHSATEDHSH